jgi:CheY-like chemotaxis protein/two-component sensor histidine kinase
MEALGRFAGAIAHDFNNVLMAILGSSALMASELARDHPLQQEAEEIRRAADRAAGLTRQLLTFSRRQLVARDTLDVHDIVENLGPMLRRLLGEDIELMLDLGEAGAAVHADRNQIEQVILNLAANARDAMPLGGRLAIEVTRTYLDEEYTGPRLELEPGCYVIIAVSDTGHGIDSETQRHIFEPFFTTKEPGEGTGLGLSTVFGIVSQSGGTVAVYSEPGHGTTFRIYLPATDEPMRTTAPAQRPSLTAATKTGGTVLVVDDEDAVRRIIERLLERAGYTVLSAADGQEAIRLATQHPSPIELLITDIVLPGPSGPEIAAQITQLHPSAKVLYSSGYPGDEITRRGLDPDALFLQKPFAPEALVGSVAQLLNAQP